MVMYAPTHQVRGELAGGGDEHVDLVAEGALGGGQFGDEPGQPGILTRGQRLEREGPDPQGRAQPRRVPLRKELLLVPDVADLLHVPLVVHQQGGLVAVRRGRVACELRDLRPRRGEELAVAEQEAHLRQLPGRRAPRHREEQLPAQRGERVVLDAVGIQPGEVDVGDVVEPHDHPAVVPGVAAPLAGLLDPFGQYMPVDESLRGVDHGQTDVVDLRRVPLGCPPLPDLPRAAAQELDVPGPVASHRGPAPLRGRPLALTNGGAVPVVPFSARSAAVWLTYWPMKLSGSS